MCRSNEVLTVDAGAGVIYYIMTEHSLWVRSGWHPRAVPSRWPATAQCPSDHTGTLKVACGFCTGCATPLPPQNFRSSVCVLKPCLWASLVAQLVKNLPAMWETWVQSLGWEDPLEKGKAAHFSILAWKMGSQRVRYDWATFTFTSYLVFISFS